MSEPRTWTASPRIRSPGPAVWIAAILLATGLAGCSGSGEATQGGAAETVTLPSGEVVAADAGVVAGRIGTDAGLPASDASVRLTSTSFRHTTGDDGAFRFVNVTAGAYTLRVEAQGFHVHEEAIEVPTAEVLTVDVTLVAKAAAGYRPHAHDLWRGQQEVTIFAGEVDLREHSSGSIGRDLGQPYNQVDAHVSANLGFGEYQIPLPADADPPALIYPGTAEVHVTFDWDDTPPMPPTYALEYRSADSTSETKLEPRGPGQTWIIPVTPEMADNGHQLFSLWDLYIDQANDARRAPDYRPSAVTEPIQVTVTVVRGDDPPLDPPHPTFWADGDELLLRDHGDGAKSASIGGSPPTFRIEDGIVPPGTSKVVVELDWSYTDADGSPIDQDYELYWNTARHNPDTRPRSQWDTADASETDGSFAVWEIPVDEADVDAFYQQKSSWRFLPVPTGSEPGDVTLDHLRTREFTLKVTALRDAGASVE